MCKHHDEPFARKMLSSPVGHSRAHHQHDASHDCTWPSTRIHDYGRRVHLMMIVMWGRVDERSAVHTYYTVYYDTHNTLDLTDLLCEARSHEPQASRSATGHLTNAYLRSGKWGRRASGSTAPSSSSLQVDSPLRCHIPGRPARRAFAVALYSTGMNSRGRIRIYVPSPSINEQY